MDNKHVLVKTYSAEHKALLVKNKTKIIDMNNGGMNMLEICEELDIPYVYSKDILVRMGIDIRLYARNRNPGVLESMDATQIRFAKVIEDRIRSNESLMGVLDDLGLGDSYHWWYRVIKLRGNTTISCKTSTKTKTIYGNCIGTMN